MSSFDKLVDEVERTSTPEERAQLDDARARFEVGGQLLERRMASGFTQQQLADASGVPQSEISRIERGNANPTIETLGALGAPLGVRLAYSDTSAKA